MESTTMGRNAAEVCRSMPRRVFPWTVQGRERSCGGQRLSMSADLSSSCAQFHACIKGVQRVHIGRMAHQRQALWFHTCRRARAAAR